MEDPIIMDDQDCVWCSKPNCQDKCPKCGLLAYCSEAHLQNHLGEDGQWCGLSDSFTNLEFRIYEFFIEYLF